MVGVGVLLSVGMQGQRGQQVRPIVEGHELAERARYLEEIGYSHIWAGDTIGREGLTNPDTISILAIAAASTTKVNWARAFCRYHSAIRLNWHTGS